MLRGRYGVRWMIIAWLAIVAAIAVAIWFGLMAGGVLRQPPMAALPAG